MPRLSRRGLLLAGGGLVLAGGAGLVEAGAVPGRTRLHDVLGLTGEGGVVPDVPRGPVVSGRFASAARRTTVGWTVVYPHRQRPDARLPVALLLQGRGGDHNSGLNDLGIDRYLTAAVEAGVPPFALAASTVDGTTRSPARSGTCVPITAACGPARTRPATGGGCSPTSCNSSVIASPIDRNFSPPDVV